MAVQDNDIIRMHLDIDTVNIPCRKAGLDWPPPERLYMEREGGFREARPEDDERFVLVRERMSSLTDEQAQHPNLARGAEYRYAKP